MRQGQPMKPQAISRMRNKMNTWMIGRCVSKAATELQMAIRMESADDDGYCRCCTCGTRVHYKACDAGHFLPGRTAAIVLEESGIHCQCRNCNRPPPRGLGGHPVAYLRYMLTRYGQAEIDRLKTLKAGSSMQWTREELLILRIKYKDRIAIQTKRLS